MVIDATHIDAFAVDLDGVVTKTAAVHAAAWKHAFDEVLERSAGGDTWQPFDPDREYRNYVDGKPRLEGIRSFLTARGISLSEGTPADGPDASTIHGLADRKDRYFRTLLARTGVEAFPDAVSLLRRARAAHIRIAVVTASENCAAVLAAAGLTDAFDVVVDGRDVLALGLHGKPAPDTFLEATRRLGSRPDRTAVFEDAIAGVRAGRAGAFAHVIGVDRTGHGDALRTAGASAVVTSLDEVDLLQRVAKERR